jgi:hypothetical protein
MNSNELGIPSRGGLVIPDPPSARTLEPPPEEVTLFR